MKKQKGRILIVEDDKEMLGLLRDVCKHDGFEVTAEEDGLRAIERIERGQFEVVVSDIKMPGIKGLELLEKTKRCSPLTAVILITAFGSIESAIKAIKLGAFDYITKPFEMEQLLVVIERALENSFLRSEVVRLHKEIQGRYGFSQMVAKSDPMMRVVELVERVSDNPSNILITGESGTGKELVGRLIHYNGPRREKAFVPINCAAIPESLLESELFGHQKGAFTDAKIAKKGLFLEADGGTLFLDEVAEMAPLIQVKVLRAVEDREIRPLGETKAHKVDARIISTSNEDLRFLVKQGSFREDLYFRLNVIEIKLPPLRERREDIPPLINFFIGKYNGQLRRRISGISPSAMKALTEYPWPGNVRELENAIEHAVSLSRGNVITGDDLPSFLGERDDTRDLLTRATEKRYTVADLEREYIIAVLQQTGGNKSRAAQILGMDRKTLYRKLQEYQIQME